VGIKIIVAVAVSQIWFSYKKLGRGGGGGGESWRKLIQTSFSFSMFYFKLCLLYFAYLLLVIIKGEKWVSFFNKTGSWS
jgi:hypothetical protein